MLGYKFHITLKYIYLGETIFYNIVAPEIPLCLLTCNPAFEFWRLVLQQIWPKKKKKKYMHDQIDRNKILKG